MSQDINKNIEKTENESDVWVTFDDSFFSDIHKRMCNSEITKEEFLKEYAEHCGMDYEELASYVGL